jgi:16S rRNA (adenine1518-N6/adenine1519-N6)-dimethyltransferase
MLNLADPDTIQSILKKNNFAPNKFLGQNFLIDEEVLEKIIKTADIKEGDNVIEIGPGLGVLTQELLKKGANVAAIEKDKELIPVLEENLKEFKNFKVVNDDFLAVDDGELISGFGDKTYKVVSNIPYYITSPVLRKILTAESKPLEIVFLVQREVAERISAKPGEMSVISVFVQFYGTPSVVAVVKPESFWPAPKVESAILRVVLDKKPVLAGDELKDFWRLVKIGFSSRRKTLANNLIAGYRAKSADVRDLLKEAGFSEKTRAQELSMGDWLRLHENS